MKYWDIIPAKKPRPQLVPTDDHLKRLREAMERLGKESREVVPYRMPFTKIIDGRDSGCLHKNCSSCHGTGIGPMGTCVHGISCPCRNCSAWMGVARGYDQHGPVQYVDARGVSLSAGVL